MNAAPCILIVDDEPNVRLVLRTALESAGYRVTEAPDGLVALELARVAACDLILLDLRMPKLDGMATLARLREAHSPAPVVMLTAHGSIPDAVSAMKLGAIDFLAKPITPAELRGVVADVLRRHQERPSPPETPAPQPAVPRRSIAYELARAKRYINRGEFDEAELQLREILAGSPDSQEAHELLDRLLVLKEREGNGSFSLLRQWFPS
jgi:DNA-binding response OmpR family regulator